MKSAQVAIVMGSDSDLATMKDAAKVLEEFSIPYEIHVLSAHRTPDETVKAIRYWEESGVKVIIAAAGGAAHLAGVCAGHFPGPVIGVPIKSKSLEGLDSLLSTAQMPPGVPVATVSIDGAKNAGLLAVQILATSDNNLKQKFVDYKRKMKAQVIVKDQKLQQVGYKKYLEQK